MTHRLRHRQNHYKTSFWQDLNVSVPTAFSVSWHNLAVFCWRAVKASLTDSLTTGDGWRTSSSVAADKHLTTGIIPGVVFFFILFFF